VNSICFLCNTSRIQPTHRLVGTFSEREKASQSDARRTRLVIHLDVTVNITRTIATVAAEQETRLERSLSTCTPS